ncbi:hypothetical protein LPJ59_002802 [Coemansia sp. RSA 2399]|nr:hypothetical protein LPJ59_002802 [Coemansia sp. RSA 2399]
MAQFKRARVSDSANGTACQHHTQSKDACRFIEEKTINLPSNIGRTATVAAWPTYRSRLSKPGTPTDTTDDTTEDSKAPKSDAQSPLVAIGTDAGCIALVRTVDDDVTVLDHGSSGSGTDGDNGTAAIQRILMAKSATAPAGPLDPSHLIPDMVTGDAEGRVAVFTLGRLFSRATLPAPVSALAADTNPHTPHSYLVGDMGGSVTCYHTHEVRWRVQLHPHGTESSASDAGGLLLLDRDDPQVVGICAVQWADDAGVPTHYVLAATGAQIHVLCHGTLVLSMPLRARCTALCSGSFTGPLENGGTQAIIGDDSGNLYILDRFTLTLYANVAYPITRIAVLPHLALSASSGPDIVVCSTQSNSVYLLCAGKIVGTYVADAWPTDVAVIETLSAERGCPALVVAETVGQTGNRECRCLLKIVAIEE